MKKKSDEVHKNKTVSKNPAGPLNLSEESNRESSEKYRNFLKNIHDGCFELDLAGKFIFFNDSVCRIAGYSSDELMGMSYRQYTDEENAKRVREEYNKVYITGKPSEGFGWQITRKDGAIRYIETSVSLQKDSSGKPAGFIGIVNDITERKQTEELLKQSESQYRILTDNVTDGIFTMDMNFNYTYASRSAYNIVGYTASELITLKVEQLVDSETLRWFAEMFAEELEIEKRADKDLKRSRVLEYQHVRKDGSKVLVETKITFLRDGNNTAVGMLGIVRDITERKRSEENLKQSKEKYRLLADHMKDAVWIMDFNLKVSYVSPSAETLLGYTQDEIIQLPLDKILTSASFNVAMDFFSIELPKALAAPPDYILTRSLELEFCCKNSQIIWGECMFSFIRDESGNPVSILGEARDITSRKQIEYELRASESNFRHSLDDSPLGVRISTIDGETIYANKAILNIYGYDSIEELKNTRLKQRYTPESYAEWKTRKKQRLEGESGTSEYEVSIIRKTGEIRHLHVFRKEIFWDGKKQSQVIYQDITEHRQAEEKLRKTMENLRQSIGATIQVLGMASEARDPYTAGHQKRVSHLARFIAKDMGLSRDVIEGIRLASSIHDIGKLSVPTEILTKPTKLTALEYSLVKEHPQSGYELLKNVDSPWPLAEIVLQHHERINGTGYPNNLKTNDILIAARIMAVADVVEAMASHRPYRPALGIEAALEEIEKNKGVFYDENVVDVCLRLFREKGYKLP